MKLTVRCSDRIGYRIVGPRDVAASEINFLFCSMTQTDGIDGGPIKYAPLFSFSPGFSYYPPTISNMSQTPREDALRFKYQVIFDRALEDYKKNTGEDLKKNPLVYCFETCDSPDAFLTTLREKNLGISQFRSSGDELLTWLDPTITVLNTFSAAIGGIVGQVSLKTFKMTWYLQPDPC
jgi:hypothetical protein